MEESSNSFAGFLFKTLLIIILLIGILFLLYLIYTIYINVPREPQNLDVIMNNASTIDLSENSSFSGVSQFHPNMKFNHNSLSYSIDMNCPEEKKQRMIEAFNYLSKEVPVISFYETPDNANIEVTCSEIEKPTIETDAPKDFFIAGEGGAKEIIQAGKYNIITNGTISLYQSPHGAIKCDFPNVEVHELIHVFGFDHSSDKKSLMNPLLNSCDQTLDSSIINELNRLCSEPNLPDLYFEDMKVVKKGRYIDFNVSIKNIGTISAENINLFVLEDGKIIEEKQIEAISFGAGLILRVENLKLNSLNPKEIRFVIDKDNLIKELDKKNNLAIVNMTHSN